MDKIINNCYRNVNAIEFTAEDYAEMQKTLDECLDISFAHMENREELLEAYLKLKIYEIANDRDFFDSDNGCESNLLDYSKALYQLYYGESHGY